MKVTSKEEIAILDKLIDGRTVRVALPAIPGFSPCTLAYRVVDGELLRLSTKDPPVEACHVGDLLWALERATAIEVLE